MLMSLSGGREAAPSEEQAAPRAPSWLAPHILVKIVDKHLCGGRCARGGIVDLRLACSWGRQCSSAADVAEHVAGFMCWQSG